MISKHKSNNMLIALYTISKKEIMRYVVIWPQTILTPVISTLIYYLLFSNIFRELKFDNAVFLNCDQFICTGLIIMQGILTSYKSTSFTIMNGKLEKTLGELFIAPITSWALILGYIISGTLRAIITCSILLFAFSFVTEGIVCISAFSILILAAMCFSALGLMNGLYSKNFDMLVSTQSLVLSPLIYLGGVFYPVNKMTLFLQNMNNYNPVFYITQSYRAAILGDNVSTIFISTSAFFVFSCMSILLFLEYRFEQIRETK